MRKRTILALMAICVIVSIVKASPVDPQSAIQVAQQFVPKSTTAQRAPMRGSSAEPSSSIVYTHMMPNSDRPAFYIVNVDDGAFVLVSADDIAHQVLGYSLNSTWPVAKDGSVELPEHIRGFFDDLAAQMEAAVEAEPTRAAGSYKAGLSSSTPNRSPSIPDSVGPLLTTTWNQGQYYNALCPEDANGPDGHVYTGCVATAMAQVVKYWSDSTPGRGTHSYSTDYGTLTVNYAETSYDYANMPNVLDENSTQSQKDAVAQLIYHCGVATNMQYGANESSSYDRDARAGLINFYRFSPNLSYAEKAFFTDTDWNDLLHQEIAANRPVLYSGFGDSGGHTFVCDGYKTDNYYHFNFGWGGFCDGWYLTSAVNPNDLNFNSTQTAIVGIVPDSSGIVILGQTTGNSTFTVDEPLEFYNLMGHNAYEGSYYNNLCDNTVTFIPLDISKQMVADIMEFEDQNISIYNGSNTSNLLRSLSGGGENDLSPVVSTANALTVNYTGNLYYAGFKLTISQDKGYRMVSNISISVDTTTVHLMWTENGTATQWQIEYGEQGFTHGNGIMFLVNSTLADITFPQRLTKYDVYIRSVCGNNNYGPWSKITIQTEAPYWQDVVVSQPTSYTIDLISNYAIISTAEDFVWFTQTAQPYDSAYFISDIDLREYKWKPVSNLFTAYTIKGNGHKISNLYINEISDFTALFSYFNGTIENVGIENAQVYGNGATACFCGKTFINGEIRNCYITNSIIEGMDQVGGLVAQHNGTIKNCYVNVNIKGNRRNGWNGLLTASSEGTIINSYAVGSVSMRSFCNYGGISAYTNFGTISNCYSIDLYPYEVIGYKGQTVISDTSSVYLNDVTWTLRTPIDFNGFLEDNLLEALNNGVIQRNDSTLRLWIADTANYGLPKFGDFFIVQCPNVTNLTVQNVKVGNISGVVVDWDKKGNAEKWEIKYQPLNTPADSVIVVNTNNVPDTIYGIPLGREYVFSVRSVSDDENHSGWTTINAMVDLPYWTDIVTMQPEGYTEDTNGNVTISSAEGLAWLSVLVNGFHGNPQYSFVGKTVTLVADVDLQSYRWYPIGRGLWDNEGGGYGFGGTFLGNNHTISNLYVNSKGMCLGLFGCAHSGASFSDITLNSGNVISYGGQRMECIGGLLGLGLQIQSIDNCHSNINVTGVEAVGSLCGQIEVNGQPITPKVTNCSASGNVFGRMDCGGLIGWIQQSRVTNCYSTGNVYSIDGDSFLENRGEFIGLLGETTVQNCYGAGYVYPTGGSVVGCIQDNSTILHYIYDLKNDHLPLLGLSSGDIADTSSFVNINGCQVLLTPITINDSTYESLLDVLNGWVKAEKDTRYKTWGRDSTNTNGGYPVFGNYYEPSCYKPSNVIITNATIVGDNTIRTQIAWEQEGNPDSWEILYVEAGQDVDSGTIIAVNSYPCILTDLPVGHLLDFYVRAICNDGDTSGWSDALTYIPDKLRWTEVVTSQPTSYRVDNRDVYVSCAEDFAWLSSVMNHLNGNSENFYPEKIIITSDIDLSAYRWTTISTLDLCTIQGNRHTIKGLYCNENKSYQGLLGVAYRCNIRNLGIEGSRIVGLRKNGTLIGESNESVIDNCTINGEVYGTGFSGGIVGESESSYVTVVSNSAFVGGVYPRENMTFDGYVGGIIGYHWSVNIINSYVSADIPSHIVSSANSSGVVAAIGGGPSIYNNIYAIYNPNNPYLTANNTESNSSFFTGSGNAWTLTTPPYIGDSFYTDLVSALNAWVDANNSDGQYSRWVPDTEYVNGGYPIFAPFNAVLDSIKPIRRDADENAIYDLTGKKIVTDDISTLPSGIYIRNGRKFMVK